MAASINVKLAQRDLAPLLAALSGFAANPGEKGGEETLRVVSR
jgi:hypothetical protein